MLLVALAVNLVVFLLACVGMMVVFMGGDGYLPVLLVLLALSLPVSGLIALAGFGWFARRNGIRMSLAAFWRHVPQWLAVTFWLGIALLFCGELALLVTLRLAEEAPAFWQHLPVLAGLLSAVAFLVIDAVIRARAPERAASPGQSPETSSSEDG